MKEYEIEVVEKKIVYVEAETKAEALELAKTEAIHEEPDTISCRVLSSIDEDDMDLTVCGQHGCDGCVFQHSHDLELCKNQRKE